DGSAIIFFSLKIRTSKSSPPLYLAPTIFKAFLANSTYCSIVILGSLLYNYIAKLNEIPFKVVILYIPLKKTSPIVAYSTLTCTESQGHIINECLRASIVCNNVLQEKVQNHRWNIELRIANKKTLTLPEVVL